MAIIGTLAVSLTAKAEEFLSGLQKAREKVVEFTMAIPGMEFACSRAGHVIEALAAGELVHLMHSTAESIDKVAKLADRLGTTTEAVVSLDHAARMTGGSADAMNTALDKLARGLGKAEEGGKAAQQALAHLGLSFDDLAGKDPAEQMRVIAERVNALGTQEEKVAAVTNLFGKNAMELVNTLALGREGLDQMAREAERLGITFSRVDAAKVEHANEALIRVHEIVQGLLQRAVIELAPYVEAVADKFQSWAVAQNMGEKVVAVVEWIATGLAKLGGVIQFVRGAFQVAIGNIIEVLAGLAQGVAEVLSTITDVINLLPGVHITFADDLVQTMKDAREQMSKFGSEGQAAMDKAGDAEKEVAGFFKDAREHAEAGAAAVAKGAQASRDGAVAGAAASRAAGEKAAAEAKAAKSAEEHAKALERQKEAMEQKTADLEFTAALSKEERRYSQELLEIEKARKNGWDELVDRMQAALKVKQDEAASEERIKAYEKLKDQAAALEEIVAARERIGTLSKEDRQFSSELLEIEKARAQGFLDLADRMQVLLDGKREELKAEKELAKLAAEKKKAAEEAERKSKAAAELLKSMNKEIELLQAGNGLARERVRIQQELEDHLEKAGKNQAARDAARLLAAEQLKKLEEDAADKAEKHARSGAGSATSAGGDGEEGDGGGRSGGKRKRKKGSGAEPFMGTFGNVRVYDRAAEEARQHAKEVAEFNEALRKDPYFGGHRPGAPAGGPSTSTGATAAPAPATSTGAAAAASPAAAAPQMPDPSPELKRANEALKKASDILGKTTEEAKALGDGMDSLVEVVQQGFDAAKANEEKLTQGVVDTKASVEALKSQLQAISQALASH